jgi:hypothetical protein
MELRAEDEAGGSSGEDEDVDEEVGISDATERSDAEEIAEEAEEEEAEEDVERAGLAEQAVVEEVSASTAATAEEQFDDATDVDPRVIASEHTNAKGA